MIIESVLDASDVRIHRSRILRKPVIISILSLVFWVTLNAVFIWYSVTTIHEIFAQHTGNLPLLWESHRRTLIIMAVLILAVIATHTFCVWFLYKTCIWTIGLIKRTQIGAPEDDPALVYGLHYGPSRIQFDEEGMQLSRPNYALFHSWSVLAGIFHEKGVFGITTKSGSNLYLARVDVEKFLEVKVLFDDHVR